MKMRANTRAAFTLVELLVVIAIIALLLAALLPAFAVVKKNAKIAQTQSMFQGLTAGITSYRGEQPLGATLPPSSSDNKTDFQSITPPGATSASGTVRATGANLLVLALMGYDGLGTPGFKNVPPDPITEWWNNQNADPALGLYALDTTTGKERHPRYGPYVDDKMRDRTSSLPELADKGRVVSVVPDDQKTAKLPFFIDAWDMPILYYKSMPGTNRMIFTATTPGIYRQEDNGVITGTVEGQTDAAGVDFGAGKEGDYYHSIARAVSPDPVLPDFENAIKTTEPYNNSFARFILDSKSKSRPAPVQADSFLLISAGPDSRYGTADDVTNWTRDTQ
jgi:prepilin-type N-terminal cleavage/methylation domain-containing protein